MSAQIKKNSVSKSTKSHATTTPAAPATVQTTDPVIAPQSAPQAGHAPLPTPPMSISEIAAKAIAQLDALEASLNLNIVVPPNDKSQMRSLRRISDTALTLATNIVTAAPESFPAFAGLPDATAYVQAMTPLAARAQSLATHVQNSVLNQRSPASTQTLALYGVAKNVGRIVSSEAMREHVAALKAEVAPKHRNPKPKLTKLEKATRKQASAHKARLDKAAALLEANGRTVLPATATPSTPPAPAVPAPAPAVIAPPTVSVTTAPAVTNGAAAVTPPAPAAH